MKNIKIFTLFLSLLCIVGCDEEEYAEYTAPDELSDISWLLGLDPSRPSREAQFKINQDTHISFFDLSQGTLSHQWIIEDGNKFLKEGFKTNDSLPLFINEEAGISTVNGKAHILFRNSGTNTVTLLNTFKEPVSPNTSGNDSENVIVETFEEDNTYGMDVKFIFDVYAHIEPAFTVFKDGTEILSVLAEDMPNVADSSTWPVVEVEAATSLTFTDNTTIGRPNRATWLIPDGVPNQPSTPNLGEASIKFYKLGTFDAGTLRSLRIPQVVNGVTDDSPNADAEKIIPLKVKVIQSSQPFIYDGALRENENEVIQFRVNGEVVPFSGQEGSFTVNVKNTLSGFDQNIPVQTARIKEGDATFIELILSSAIYNSDTITVSYTGTSLVSADNRTLQPFGPETVQMHFGNNILANKDWGGFEQSNTAGGRAFAGSDYFVGGKNGNFGDLVWERVESKKHSGFASMQFKTPSSTPLPNNFNLFGFGLSKPAGIPAGTYRVSYWVNIDSSTNLSAFRMEFGNGNRGEDVYTMPPFDISTKPKDTWVQASGMVTFTNDIAGGAYRTTLRFTPGDNPGLTGGQLMYFDDLSLIEIEVRP